MTYKCICGCFANTYPYEEESTEETHVETGQCHRCKRGAVILLAWTEAEVEVEVKYPPTLTR